MKSEVVIDKDNAGLTDILNTVNASTSLDQAKECAKTFINSLRSSDKVQGLMFKLENCPSIARVQALCYNILLSGEGMGTKKKGAKEGHRQWARR